jgi:hypothetical protein
VNPLSNDIISVVISVQLSFVPRNLAILKNKLCFNSEDGVISMDTKKSSIVFNDAHQRSDDHVDTITNICGLESFGLFYSSSRDGTIKVWDMSNSLIK